MVVGNEGWVRELAYTGRSVDSHEALKYGLVTRVFKDQSTHTFIIQIYKK